MNLKQEWTDDAVTGSGIRITLEYINSKVVPSIYLVHIFNECSFADEGDLVDWFPDCFFSGL